MVANAPAAPKRTFVPQSLDVADWLQVEPVARQLLDRNIASAAELKAWLLDFSELTSVIDEYGNRRYIDKSCHTEDKEIEKAFLHFVENIEPKFKPLFFAMQKKFLQSPHRSQLPGDKRFEMLIRHWQPDVELYRDENVPLETAV